MHKIATLELASRFALQVLFDVLAGALELSAVASRLQGRHVHQAPQGLHAPPGSVAQEQLQTALLRRFGVERR